MAEEYDFTDKSEQEILLSYTANKVHRARNVNKINNLLTLQDQKYSKVTEATLLGLVSSLERYQDRVNVFSAWLALHELWRGKRILGMSHIPYSPSPTTVKHLPICYPMLSHISYLPIPIALEL